MARALGLALAEFGAQVEFLSRSSARASGASLGGNVEMRIRRALRLERATVTANVEGADDGNVLIANPNGIALRDDSAIVAQAETVGGTGGTIDVTTDAFFAALKAHDFGSFRRFGVDGAAVLACDAGASAAYNTAGESFHWFKGE